MPQQLVPKTKVMSPLIPGEQCQDVVLNGEPLEDVNKFNNLDLCSSPTPRAQRSEAGLILPLPYSLVYNPGFGPGVKYRCLRRAGSIGFALRLRNVASTNGRQKHTGGL